MAKIGSKENCFLNGEFCKRVIKKIKKQTAHIRRQNGRKEITFWLNQRVYDQTG
jgi:hypothetical protein